MGKSGFSIVSKKHKAMSLASLAKKNTHYVHWTRRVISGMIVSVLLTIPSMAHNKVVVVPLFDAVTTQEIGNVLTVALEGGDFTNLKTAMASINDASVSNPYLIQIGPGVYDMSTIGVVVKSHVSIVGSGQGITIVSGLNSGAESSELEERSPIILMSNSRISNLTVANNSNGGSLISSGLSISGDNVVVENLTVNVTASSNTSVGIQIDESVENAQVLHSKIFVSSSPLNTFIATGIRNVGTKALFSELQITVIGSGLGGSRAEGIHDGTFGSGMTSRLESSTIEVRNADNINALLYNGNSAIVNNSRIIADSPTGTIPILATEPVGVFLNASSIEIHNSVIKSDGMSIANYPSSSTAYIATTQLVGSIFGSSFVCFQNYDESLAAIACP